MGMKPIIIADHRERDLVRCWDDETAVVQVEQLQVGDVICSDRVGVERKRIEDFLQSIIDQRLFTQLENLTRTFECPILVVEGNQDLLFSRGLHENTIRGVFSSIAIDYKVPIIWTQNTQETADQLFWIAKREQGNGKRSFAIRANKKPVTLAEQQAFLVAGLPGINAKRAAKLLEKFKTPERIFRATEKQLLKIDGFGEKMITRMKSVLKTQYDATSSDKPE